MNCLQILVNICNNEPNLEIIPHFHQIIANPSSIHSLNIDSYFHKIFDKCINDPLDSNNLPQIIFWVK